MIKMQNFVSESQAVEVLNLKPPSPSTYARFIQKFLKADNPEAPPRATARIHSILMDWVDREVESSGDTFTRNPLRFAPYFKPRASTAGRSWRLPANISRVESRPIGEALASAHLRILVDDWLNTGRDRDGAESPSQRNIHKTLSGWHAVLKFSEQYPASILPSLNTSGFELVVAEPSSGGLQAADFFEAAHFEANRLFGGIIASDWSQRLCKCRHVPCGKYFVPKKLRGSYRHGTFCCREHRNHASSVAVVRAQRSQAKRSLVDLAAKWLVEQDRTSAWRVKADLKLRLAAFLTQRMGKDPSLRTGRESVQVNWVTRNSEAIEKRRLELVNKRRKKQ